jgi:hypothetical protein
MGYSSVSLLSTLGLPNGQFGPSWGRQLQALDGRTPTNWRTVPLMVPLLAVGAAPDLRNRHPMIHARALAEALCTPAGFALPVAQ